MTFRSRAIERQAFDRAAVAAGEVIACDRDVDWFGLNRQYKLVCRFLDRNQVTRNVEFVLAGHDTRAAASAGPAVGPFPMSPPDRLRPPTPRPKLDCEPALEQTGRRSNLPGVIPGGVSQYTPVREPGPVGNLAGLARRAGSVAPFGPLFVITFLLWMGFLIDEVLRFATRRWW